MTISLEDVEKELKDTQAGFQVLCVKVGYVLMKELILTPNFPAFYESCKALSIRQEKALALKEALTPPVETPAVEEQKSEETNGNK